MKRKQVWIAAGAVAAVAIAVGLWLFQPWKAFTSSELHEDDPLKQQAPTGQQAAPQAQPQLLAEGRFVSQEHETSGAAKLIERADGRIVLRVESLASSDGPDLYLWLSDQPAGEDDYTTGRHVDLGDLKATHGDHNYLLPEGTDVDGLRSAVIWCERFGVAFGSAELAAV